MVKDKEGNKESVKLLTEQGYQPTESEIVEGDGYCNSDTLKGLLEQKVPFEISDEGETPLSMLCDNNTELAGILYKAGAKPNEEALCHVIENEDTELAKKMIQDCTEEDVKQMQTALSTAIRRGDLKLVQLFVEKGTDVKKAVEDNGISYSPIQEAKDGLSKEVRQILEKYNQ